MEDLGFEVCNQREVLREVKGRLGRSRSQTDVGFTVAWLCRALPGHQGHLADASDAYVI